MHRRYIIDSSSDDYEESIAYFPDTSDRPPLAGIRRSSRLNARNSNAPDVDESALNMPEVNPSTKKRKAPDAIEPKSTKIARVERQELADVGPADEQNNMAEEDEE
ncbi:hypothetical protein LQW54_012121 [Pestalotiopsis sp. IQ-011]